MRERRSAQEFSANDYVWCCRHWWHIPRQHGPGVSRRYHRCQLQTLCACYHHVGDAARSDERQVFRKFIEAEEGGDGGYQRAVEGSLRWQINRESMLILSTICWHLGVL